MKTLKDYLQDWTDIDVAGYYLAISLGLMTTETDFTVDAKHVFWSANALGEFLYRTLETMVALEILEKRPNPYLAYRWNAEFKGSWE